MNTCCPADVMWTYMQPVVDLREKMATKDQCSLWCFRFYILFIGILCLCEYRHYSLPMGDSFTWQTWPLGLCPYSVPPPQPPLLLLLTHALHCHLRAMLLFLSSFAHVVPSSWNALVCLGISLLDSASTSCPLWRSLPKSTLTLPYQ